jgi:hypothetical protein
MTEQPKVHEKILIRWTDLIRPWVPYSLEVRCEVFRWMIATGWHHDDDAAGGVFNCLYNESGGSHQSHWWLYHGLDADWETELERAFLHALLDNRRAAAVDEWRKKWRIELGKERWLPIRIRDKRYCSMLSQLNALLKDRGVLAVQLNSCHKRAKQIQKIRLTCNYEMWHCYLDYGFSGEKWGSVWHHQMAVQQPRELFADFVPRCLAELARLKGGAK